jgi:hypothetical protein
MNNDLLFDFNVDKTAKTVYITREFNAGLSLVWDAFTKAELLDQWGAPAPMRAKTKYMNFEVGGRRFYAMIGPDGQERCLHPLPQRPILRCTTRLPIRTKIGNYRVLIGITISANKMA